jgi:hypothetical protein
MIVLLPYSWDRDWICVNNTFFRFDAGDDYVRPSACTADPQLMLSLLLLRERGFLTSEHTLTARGRMAVAMDWLDPYNLFLAEILEGVAMSGRGCGEAYYDAIVHVLAQVRMS